MHSFSFVLFMILSSLVFALPPPLSLSEYHAMKKRVAERFHDPRDISNPIDNPRCAYCYTTKQMGCDGTARCPEYIPKMNAQAKRRRVQRYEKISEAIVRKKAKRAAAKTASIEHMMKNINLQEQ
jgi:hypothetical protein